MFDPENWTYCPKTKKVLEIRRKICNDPEEKDKKVGTPPGAFPEKISGYQNKWKETEEQDRV